MKNRIWELDAARGIGILGMVLVHLLYDLRQFFGFLPAGNSLLLSFLMDWGGVLFFLICGICVTLGSHPVRRGLLVLGCGLLVSAVTRIAVALGFFESSMIIRFGVLHSLGVCMLLWPLVKKLPWPVLAGIGGILVVLGLYLEQRAFAFAQWLYPLGLRTPQFVSADYFPLLPFFGFFLLGAVFGKTLYRKKTSLFPNIRQENPLIRFLSLTGRWSLPVYLLHQPVLTGLLMLLEVIL